MKASITLFLFCVAFAAFGQNILVVDNNPGAAADYTTAQAAANAADPGDFIYIVPSGDSYGSLGIEKELHVRGLGHLPLGTNGLASTLNNITFQNDCGNSSVSGLNVSANISSFTNTSGFNANVVISNCYTRYLNVGGDNWTIEGCIINNDQGNVRALGVNEHDNTTIHHNYIRHISNLSNTAAIGEAPESTLEYNNLYVVDEGRLMWNCTNLEFQNSIILSLENGDNLNFQGSTGWTFNNCLSYNYNGFAVPLTGNGDNNLEDTEPLFETLQNGSPLFSYSNNYSPAIGSPLIGAASDGDNIGIYNENFDFDQRGHAIDLPYITEIDILNPAVEPEESLEINFSAFGN
jgi:hypothetical protein